MQTPYPLTRMYVCPLQSERICLQHAADALEREKKETEAAVAK